MTDRLWKFFTSLRLTVTLLAFGILLVWVGTVAQADEGLYVAQERYFKHWFVFGITLFGRKIAMPLPGGYLIGTVLLINLTAAFIKRFQWTVKKLGIHLTHIGIILLLGGQLATDLLSRETQMRIREGETKSFSESGMDYELAFLSDAGTNADNVVAIPQRMLSKGGEIKHEKLPFTVRMKEFWPNSDPAFRAPMDTNLPPPVTTNGVANSFDFHSAEVTHDMDRKNAPTAVIELQGATGSLGTWVVSGWAGDEAMSESLRRFYEQQRGMGPQLAATIYSRLIQPQFVAVDGKQFRFALRPVRAYKPFFDDPAQGDARCVCRHGHSQGLPQPRAHRKPAARGESRGRDLHEQSVALRGTYFFPIGHDPKAIHRCGRNAVDGAASGAQSKLGDALRRLRHRRTRNDHAVHVSLTRFLRRRAA
jgi:hypothetical protein